MELVVTDDGSEDETSEVVEAFARQVDFPVKITTHPPRGFRLARSRNEGVAASRAPYLLFTDGDCLLPPDHVATHLEFRRPRTVVAGDCYRLSQADSQRVDEAAIRTGEYVGWVSWRQRARMAKKAVRGWIDHLFRCRMRPRLTGSNIALWREDFERINGFDENYVGWGLEDRDLQLRLSRIGVLFRPIVGRTAPYHLWHPAHPTYAHNNANTPNLNYFRRPLVFTRCRTGLVKRRLSDLNVRVVGNVGSHPRLERLLRKLSHVVACDDSPETGVWQTRAEDATRGIEAGLDLGDLTGHPDVEILMLGEKARFSGAADCNILVAPDGAHIPMSLRRKAHVVLTAPRFRTPIPAPHFTRGLSTQPLAAEHAT